MNGEGYPTEMTFYTSDPFEPVLKPGAQRVKVVVMEEGEITATGDATAVVDDEGHGFALGNMHDEPQLTVVHNDETPPQPEG